MINSWTELLLRKQELEMLIKTLDEAVEHGSTSTDRIQKEINDKQSEITEYMNKIGVEGTQGHIDPVGIKGAQGSQGGTHIGLMGYDRCYEPDTKVTIPDIAEPAVSNLFLVDLPINEIKDIDINKLSIYWENRTLSIEVREPIERDILNPIIEYMDKSLHYQVDDIKVAIIDRAGTVKYTRTFTNVCLVGINESDYDYSKTSPHVFELIFTFKEQKIERNNILNAYYNQI